MKSLFWWYRCCMLFIFLIFDGATVNTYSCTIFKSYKDPYHIFNLPEHKNNLKLKNDFINVRLHKSQWQMICFSRRFLVHFTIIYRIRKKNQPIELRSKNCHEYKIKQMTLESMYCMYVVLCHVNVYLSWQIAKLTMREWSSFMMRWFGKERD